MLQRQGEIDVADWIKDANVIIEAAAEEPPVGLYYKEGSRSSSGSNCVHLPRLMSTNYYVHKLYINSIVYSISMPTGESNMPWYTLSYTVVCESVFSSRNHFGTQFCTDWIQTVYHRSN